jgi:hypothetical protein
LLLLYLIDRESQPRGWDPEKPIDQQSRLPLLAGLEGHEILAHHILGIGIVFPDVSRATARHFVRVRLERPAEGEVFEDEEILSLENDGDGDP